MVNHDNDDNNNDDDNDNDEDNDEDEEEDDEEELVKKQEQEPQRLKRIPPTWVTSSSSFSFSFVSHPLLPPCHCHWAYM